MLNASLKKMKVTLQQFGPTNSPQYNFNHAMLLPSVLFYYVMKTA